MLGSLRRQSDAMRTSGHLLLGLLGCHDALPLSANRLSCRIEFNLENLDSDAGNEPEHSSSVWHVDLLTRRGSPNRAMVETKWLQHVDAPGHRDKGQRRGLRIKLASIRATST